MKHKMIVALITLLTTIPLTNMKAMQENQDIDINLVPKIEKESEELKLEEHKDVDSKTDSSNQSENIEEVDKSKKWEAEKINENKKNLEKPKEDKKEEKKEDIENVDPEIEKMKNKINEISNNINNLDKTKAREASKQLKPIGEKLKELKTTNKKAVSLYWQTKDLIDLLRAIGNLKQIERDNLKIEKLIKENKSKTKITKELKNDIEKINKNYKAANEILPGDIDSYKKHIEKEGKNNIFYVDEFRNLVKNLENTLEKFNKGKEKLDLLTEKINENKKNLEKPKEDKKEEKKEDIENVDPEIEKMKNKINEISNNINNLDRTKAREASKQLKPIGEKLKELKTTNKKAVSLYWQTKDLIDLLRAIGNLKQIERDNLKIEKLIKENKSKTKITKELKNDIEKINKNYKAANEILPGDIDSYKKHIEKEGKNNIFYVDEFKNLVKNLENTLEKFNKSKEKLDLLTITKEIKENKIAEEKEYNEKIHKIKEVLEQQNWDEYDATKIDETIKEISDIKDAIINLKKDDEETKTTYYKANSLQKLLNAKKSYMESVELETKIIDLENTINTKSEKNVIEEDTNEQIKKLNKKLDEVRVKISENIKRCEDHISKENKSYIYFVEEIKTQLDKLKYIDENLKNEKEKLSKTTKTAINKIIKYMEEEAGYLKKEYERLKKTYYDDDKDEEDYEEDIDDFYRNLDEFENSYKINYENIKSLDKESAEKLKDIYESANTKHLRTKF